MAAIDSFRGAIAGMSAKDRRSLGILLAVLGVGLLFALWLLSRSVLDDAETQRQATLEALRVIRNERPRIRLRQQQRAQVLGRYETRAPALGGFVEQAARTAQVTVAETNDRPMQRVDGGRFERRSVSIRLRQVSLQGLVSFMNEVDGATFPVAITTLRMRKRFNESNQYDVDEMVITTFDRILRPGERGTGPDAGVPTSAVAVPSAAPVAMPSAAPTVSPTAVPTTVPINAPYPFPSGSPQPSGSPYGAGQPTAVVP
ncbi:MAG: hypothetical protein Q8Q09_13820 [Deltaproteobacteria bacterium]|nr:hypothetical protein [Deltaproteobacteria bacterium]